MLRRAGRQLLARDSLAPFRFSRLGISSLDAVLGFAKADELTRSVPTSVKPGYKDCGIYRNMYPKWRDSPAICSFVSLTQANGLLWNRFGTSCHTVLGLGDQSKKDIVRQVSTLNGYDRDDYPRQSRACSSSAVDEEKKVDNKPPPQRLEDFQHEEIVGPTVERDMSALANEMRQALLELRDVARKFSTFLLVVGSVHLIWGGVMFLAMESPLSHAILTQVCMSSLVFVGLAYHSRQALKPIAFFSKLEERSRLRILTLSLQATKAIISFFQRGYGIGLVLSLTLSAHLLGCVKTFFF